MPLMLREAQEMPIVTDIVGGVPEGIPIVSNDVEMEEGNIMLEFIKIKVTSHKWAQYMYISKMFK